VALIIAATNPEKSLLLINVAVMDSSPGYTGTTPAVASDQALHTDRLLWDAREDPIKPQVQHGCKLPRCSFASLRDR
jgi:hypothetical protein